VLMRVLRGNESAGDGGSCGGSKVKGDYPLYVKWTPVSAGIDRGKQVGISQLCLCVVEMEGGASFVVRCMRGRTRDTVYILLPFPVKQNGSVAPPSALVLPGMPNFGRPHEAISTGRSSYCHRPQSHPLRVL